MNEYDEILSTDKNCIKMNMVWGDGGKPMGLSRQQHHHRKILTSELLSQINRQREGSYECECMFSCMNAPVYVF